MWMMDTTLWALFSHCLVDPRQAVGHNIGLSSLVTKSYIMLLNG